MNAMRAVRYVGGALVVLTTLSAYAQSNGVTTAVPATPASVSAKAMRTASRQLQKKVRYVLVRTKGLNASGISVRAYDGAVTLQGWVPEQSQAALAAQTVQGVPGVTSVKSELIVRPISQ